MANYKIIKLQDTSAGMFVTFEKQDIDLETSEILVPLKHWKNNKCCIGDMISHEQYEEYNKSAIINMAISRTIKILSYSDHSKSQLSHKLAKYGFDKEISEQAIEYAVEHGYINEEAQAKRAVEYYVKTKNWGKKRIAADLLFKGYDKQAILAATSSIDEKTYLNSLKKLIHKKYPSLPTTKEDVFAMYTSLSRLGYSMSEIQAAEKELLKNE